MSGTLKILYGLLWTLLLTLFGLAAAYFLLSHGFEVLSQEPPIPRSSPVEINNLSIQKDGEVLGNQFVLAKDEDETKVSHVYFWSAGLVTVLGVVLGVAVGIPKVLSGLKTPPVSPSAPNPAAAAMLRNVSRLRRIRGQEPVSSANPNALKVSSTPPPVSTPSAESASTSARAAKPVDAVPLPVTPLPVPAPVQPAPVPPSLPVTPPAISEPAPAPVSAPLPTKPPAPVFTPPMPAPQPVTPPPAPAAIPPAPEPPAPPPAPEPPRPAPLSVPSAPTPAAASPRPLPLPVPSFDMLSQVEPDEQLTLTNYMSIPTSQIELMLTPRANAAQLRQKNFAASPFAKSIDPHLRLLLKRALIQLIDNHDTSLESFVVDGKLNIDSYKEYIELFAQGLKDTMGSKEGVAYLFESCGFDVKPDDINLYPEWRWVKKPADPEPETNVSI
ncbi:MAG: hypothetical protein LBK60_02190 [Verrucomicrobiales bacterium]|jgi:hypothetical protein|nr:hypothetical protein [Verrucomicrobiales bacterium]